MLLALLVIGILGALGFGVMALRGFERPRSLAELQQQLDCFDTEAFLNLIDPSEDRFLHTRLPRRQYLKFRRKRIRASLAYLAQACANARVLLAYAQPALTAADAATAATARQLAGSALQFQILAIGVRLRLCSQWVLPARRLAASEIMEAYEQLRFRLQRIVALEAPAVSARVAAGL
ncbi:MAG: hypothetical protein JO041_01780 [Acidobacteria bacterium]|nr:hypothetical protein [Acidobacteriota bacterium]